MSLPIHPREQDLHVPDAILSGVKRKSRSKFRLLCDVKYEYTRQQSSTEGVLPKWASMLRPPTVAVGLNTLAKIGTSLAFGNAPSLAPCDGLF
jgi:hypothetical protein